jgi:hypothetical protein
MENLVESLIIKRSYINKQTDQQCQCQKHICAVFKKNNPFCMLIDR